MIPPAEAVTVPPEGEAAPPVAPESPDGFRLGSEPPRVMRLSRKTLAMLGGAAGLVIGGALLYALQPADPKEAENLYRAENRNRPDTIAGAPVDYGSIPKLGPPLPGDLGRPIVAAQSGGNPVTVPPIGAQDGEGAPSAAETARVRAEQEWQSARASRLFLGSSGAMADGAAAGGPALERPDEMPTEVPTKTSGRRAFLTPRSQQAENEARIAEASSPYILQAGSVIPAALITAVNSDLPGQVTAQVTQNVYDSPTGTRLLIPQGARLVGEYDSEIAAGQNRVLLAWDRLILPGGRSIQFGRQPGADAAGRAGLADRTNHHWGRTLRAALVSTMLGIGINFADDSEDRLIQALRESGQDTVSQTGRKLVEREMAVSPTLTIRAGAPMRVVVTRDLIFEPVGGNQP